MANMEGQGDVVLRVERNRNFKTISLEAVNDERLSWKAKGIHTYLITRPDGWKFYRADLEERAPDGRDSLSTGLRQLREAGYLRIESAQGPGGKLSGWSWTVYESAGVTE